MLEQLSFITDVKRWGYPFHRGQIEMTRADFEVIAVGMGLEPSTLEG
jgi:uncharacterized protein (UPF0128 family)